MTETIGPMEGSGGETSLRPSERVWAYGWHFLDCTTSASSGKLKDMGRGVPPISKLDTTKWPQLRSPCALIVTK